MDSGPPTPKVPTNHVAHTTKETTTLPITTAPLAADTGSTGHFFPLDYVSIHSPILKEIQPATTPITIVLPNGSTIRSTHIANLHLRGPPP